MKKSTRKFDEISCGLGTSKKFPTQLVREDYFKCPIWFADAPEFVKELNKASDYIGITTANLLLEQGFDLTNYQIFITELWVQEFSSKGGGHHTLHTHWNGHMSGFYFLKASDKTSRPMFQDPRHGAIMNLLPEKDISKPTYASWQINYEAKPGRMIFFPSYMPHMYVVDPGLEPFRFIHFNCQAIPIGVLNAHKNKK